MPTVFSSDAERHWYRDVLLAPDELYCSPRAPNAPPRLMNRPTGRYDVAAYLKTLPAPWNDPSLVAILDDNGGNSIPCNLEAVKCPKVLIICDTHHTGAPGKGPIGRPLEHALEQKYDLVVGQFCRHHLHFFREAGIQAAWIPCLTLTPFEHAPDTPKRRELTFVGNTGHHPFRQYVIDQLAARGIAVQRATASQRETAALHAESRINLNISLNADLNLRHFEVLAAGGFLLTESLPPESGLDLLLEDRRHMACFGNPAQAAELVRYYLAHPEEAAEIAAAGHAEYLQSHRPATKIQQFHDTLAGRGPAQFDLRLDRRTALPAQDIDSLRRRLALYEMLQELHRSNLRLDLLFWQGAQREAADCIDLPRLKVGVLQAAPGAGDALVTARLDDRVEWVAPAELATRSWNLVVGPVSMLNDPLFQQGLQSRRWNAVAFSGSDASRDAAALEAFRQRYRLAAVSRVPPLFTLPAS